MGVIKEGNQNVGKDQMFNLTVAVYDAESLDQID
jgi:hypothetical protein